MARAQVKVQAIIPDKFDLEMPLIGEILNATESYARYIRRQLKKPTDTWAHKPTFEIEKAGPRADGSVSSAAYTEDINYVRIDQGTEAHEIAPKKYPYLALKNTIPKTSPRSLEARPGQTISPPSRVYHPVTHPGIEARHFTDVVRDKAQGGYPDQIDLAIKKGLMKGVSRTSHTEG